MLRTFAPSSVVVPVEDRFKLFIEILIGNTTEFVKDAAHLRPVIRGRAR